MISELQKEKNFWKFFVKNSMNGEIVQLKVLNEIQRVNEIQREFRNFEKLLGELKKLQEKKIQQNEMYIKQILPMVRKVQLDFSKLNKGGKKQDGTSNDL